MLVPDLRYAVAASAACPFLPLAAVVSLALGIATSTTVSACRRGDLRPPPFAEADRLTVLNITQRTPSEGEQRLRWSWPRFQLLQQDLRSFDGLASSSNAVLTITGVDDPEPLPGGDRLVALSDRDAGPARARPWVHRRRRSAGQGVTAGSSATICGNGVSALRRMWSVAHWS